MKSFVAFDINKRTGNMIKLKIETAVNSNLESKIRNAILDELE